MRGEHRTMVAIVGGGIAGIWTGLKLAEAGVPTTLLTYRGRDRGGVQGATGRSVGAVNTAPLNRDDFREFMDDLGLGQQNPQVTDLMLGYLREELETLTSLAEFRPIKLGVALASGNAGSLLNDLHARFESLGGRVVDGWVSRIVVDEVGCKGLQYQAADGPGKLLANAIVIASGGYSGLFDGAVKTPAYGTMLGRFLEAGGLGSNLEFVFKHGYGKPDLGSLTPTEELPGAEIYDSDGVHVEWLERELFEGRGTANHLQAFKHWRRNQEKDFFIDLTYRELFSKVEALNLALRRRPAPSERDVGALIEAVAEAFDEERRHAVQQRVRQCLAREGRVSFDDFETLKVMKGEVERGQVFRVRQIAYFSMGGIAHNAFATSLPDVYVSGEAMHDFGAHRVGGLPWGLYLVAGRVIADRLIPQVRSGQLEGARDFALAGGTPSFDADLLNEIRLRLHRHQENDLKPAEAAACIDWLRETRRRLRAEQGTLPDGVSWLLVAEAIMQSSLVRRESRGCFYRSDFPTTSDELSNYYSCARYDADRDEVQSELVRRADYGELIDRSARGDYRDVIG